MRLNNGVRRLGRGGACGQMAGFPWRLVRPPRRFVANVTDAAASSPFNESKALRAAGSDGGIL